jgi:hypothetical protein
VRSRARLVLLGAILFAGAVIAARLMDAINPPARTGFSLAVLPFAVDTTDSLMTAYRRQLLDRVNRDVGGRREWELVTDTGSATHVLSGALRRRGFSVEVFVQLVRRPGRRHLWADSILDSYAFSGNSTLTADRITRSVSRLLQTDTATAVRP